MNAVRCRASWPMRGRRCVVLFAALVVAARIPCAGEGTALPLAPGWTTRSLLASPHATQAAAADERHVYVVSSTTVAQYDRGTGRLMAAATAAGTEHLNSGFLHDGRLYCAHSNYPRTPAESDIRVFDPATGRLEAFHHFADPPGSLVWCVVREGHWWCCFAHYGADNARTVLVEYADGTFVRELARYVFPEAVVADWDGMSGSGGIWQGDELLVSHHHFRVLYRLRLPRHGGVLEFLGARGCPFPGQGFAADPLTGGLVGIDRDQRRVVFATREAGKSADF